ncbi:hypothetical protein [Streptomyces sp. NPDC056820]|uniref:hypothetical protein n=1 Tax=Streptomyces sp. NPDC056820 TaxID=3345951 RepID=UPI0036CA7B96
MREDRPGDFDFPCPQSGDLPAGGGAGRDEFRQALSCVSHASSGSVDHGTRW